LGQDTAEILQRLLGLTTADIERLTDAKTIAG
jgi:2-methylfumaryl-CoA isomerase